MLCGILLRIIFALFLLAWDVQKFKIPLHSVWEEATAREVSGVRRHWRSYGSEAASRAGYGIHRPPDGPVLASEAAVDKKLLVHG